MRTVQVAHGVDETTKGTQRERTRSWGWTWEYLLLGQRKKKRQRGTSKEGRERWSEKGKEKQDSTGQWKPR